MLRIALTIVALIWPLTVASELTAEEGRVRLELTRKRVLTGRAIDLRRGELEVREGRVSRRIAKNEIVNWSFQEGKGEGSPEAFLVLDQGHEVRGKISFSQDSGEWIVQFEKASARYPEDRVKRVVYPSGRCSDGSFTPRRGFDERLKRAMDKLIDAPEDLREESRKELAAMGFFAIPAIEKALTDGRTAGGHLRAILYEETLRVLLPPGIEASLPSFLEDSLSSSPPVAVGALRQAILEGFDVYYFLAHILVDDTRPAEVRKYAVETLRGRHRVEELLVAYGKSTGRAQLAVGIALGDLGVYIGIPTLIEALELDSGPARRLAVRKLQEYTGENFGFDPSALKEENLTPISRWQDWYRSNRGQIEETLVQAVNEDEKSPQRRKAARIWQQGNQAWDDGDTSMAETLYRRAIHEDPTCLPPYVGMGILTYRTKGDYEKAIEWFTRALKKAPSDGAVETRRLAFYHLGRIYSASLNLELSRQAFQKAIEIDPDYADARYDLGDVIYRTALRLGRDATAEQRMAGFEEAADIWEKGYAKLVSYRRGLVLLKRGQMPSGTGSRKSYNTSLRDLKLELRAQEARFANRLAQVHLALHRGEKALEWIELALQSPQPESGFHENHARILSGLGRAEEAQAALQKAKALTPREPVEKPKG